MIRQIPFIYSATLAYKIEMGDRYMRFFYGDSLLTSDGKVPDGSNEVWIPTPYLEKDLFELCFRQVGDVMWITHANYAPRKLKRTSPYIFTLEEIEFTKGPFLMRNDLIDPDISKTAFMKSSVTALNAEGTLTCQDNNANPISFFVDEHVGALFKLTQPRTVMMVTGSGAEPGLIVGPIDIKGSFTLKTHGSWTATLVFERNENECGWENFRTFRSVASDYNFEDSFVEKSNNVQYEGKITAFAGGVVYADIISNEPTQDGIVKVTGIINSSKASIKVLTKIDSTDATRRWAEGAWSSLRGYPSSITFFEERCVYGGMIEIPEQVIY